MPRWLPHVQANQAPPDAFCKHLRDLHLTQMVEAAPGAEAGDPRHSILTGGKEKEARKGTICPLL